MSSGAWPLWTGGHFSCQSFPFRPLLPVPRQDFPDQARPGDSQRILRGAESVLMAISETTRDERQPDAAACYAKVGSLIVVDGDIAPAVYRLHEPFERLLVGYRPCP